MKRLNRNPLLNRNPHPRNNPRRTLLRRKHLRRVARNEIATVFELVSTQLIIQNLAIYK